MTNKKLIWFLAICIIIMVGVTVVVLNSVKNNVFSFLNQFSSLTVTIDNQSEFNLLSIETGVMISGPQGETVKSGSKDVFESEIKRGEVVKFRPNLSLSGEGGVYLEFTDSRGETTNTMICSYTESLSGYSNIVVKNNNTNVTDRCN